MDRSDTSDLTDLRWHWEDVYRIDCDYRDGHWSAEPLHGQPGTLTAPTAMELRLKIRDDYAERRVREQGGAG